MLVIEFVRIILQLNSSIKKAEKIKGTAYLIQQMKCGTLYPRKTPKLINTISGKKKIKKKSLFALLTGIQVQSEVHRGIKYLRY